MASLNVDVHLLISELNVLEQKPIPDSSHLKSFASKLSPGQFLVDSLTPEENNVLSLAITQSISDPTILSKFIDAGCKADYVCPDSGETPIMITIRTRNILSFTQLLYMSPQKVVDGHGRTALHLTGEFNMPQMMSSLLDLPDVPINYSDSFGRTALHWACHFAMVENIKKLFELKAQLLMTRTNETILHYSIRSGNTETIQLVLLLWPELDVFAPNERNETPLDMSRNNPEYSTFTSILEAHADKYKQVPHSSISSQSNIVHFIGNSGSGKKAGGKPKKLVLKSLPNS